MRPPELVPLPIALRTSRELTLDGSSFLCVWRHSCLVSDARTSRSVLTFLHLSGFHAAMIKGLSSQIAQLGELASVRLVDPAPVAAAKPLGVVAEPWGSQSTAASAELCARLHAIGYSLGQVSFALSALLRPEPRRTPSGPRSESAKVPSDPGRNEQAASHGPQDALPLIAMLLPLRTAGAAAAPTTFGDASSGYRHPNEQGLQDDDPPSAMRPSPLALALRAVHGVVAEATAAVAAADSLRMPTAGWPMVTLARGEASVELIDVKALHRDLDFGTDVAEAQPTSSALSSNAEEVLRGAVATNSAQERMHAALHVLSSCRRVVLFIGLSAQIDRRFAPRLDLLLSTLYLLSPPAPPALPTSTTALAPVLATCCLALLRSLGDYWRVPSQSQLEVMSACLAALLPPATMPATARTSLYLLLISLLEPLKAASGMAEIAAQYEELAAKVYSLLSGSGSSLVDLLVFDASEGSPAGQIAALTLLGALLAFQPMDGSWTERLCRSGALRRLAAPLGLRSSPLSTALVTVLTERAPPPGAQSAIWFIESFTALLTQGVQVLVDPSSCHEHGREQARAMLSSSDVLIHLMAAAYLDLAIPTEEPLVSVLADSLPPRAELLTRLVLPTLRLVGAACAVESSPSSVRALLASFLLRSEDRIEAMVAVLHLPAHHLRRGSSSCLAHSGAAGAAGASRLRSDELMACELLLQQLALLLRTTRCSALRTQTTADNSAPEELQTPTLEAVRRYMVSALHLIPSLACMLPVTSGSHAARLADAVEAVVKNGVPLSAAFTAGNGAAPRGSSFGFAKAARSGVGLDTATACQSAGTETTEVELTLARTLCKAMAVIAYDQTSADSAEAMAPCWPARPQPAFAPDLTRAAAQVGGAPPPLGLVAALVSWALDYLLALDRAHATCAAVAHQRMISSLSSPLLRALIIALSDHLPPARGGAPSQTRLEITAGTMRSRMLLPRAGAHISMPKVRKGQAMRSFTHPLHCLVTRRCRPRRA